MISKDYLFVGVQIILFGIIAFWGRPHFESYSYLTIIGGVLGVAGLLISILALLQLNRNLSIFPTPLKSGVLITHGLYSKVRHPIYLGVILTALGWSLFTASIPRMLSSILLIVLFYMKSGYEESMLVSKFPEYLQYKQQSWRIFPWI